MSRAIFTVALVLQYLCAIAVSQEGESDKSAYYIHAVSEYSVVDAKVAPNEKKATTYNLTNQPLMSWTSVGDYDGCIFAWTRNGRPEVLATIFSGPRGNTSRRNVFHEFVSFAEQPLQISRPSGEPWSPAPLTNWTQLPDSPVAGQSPTQLKLQARNLVKQFSASLNRLGETWEMRLLPTPLCEYGGPDQTAKFGALFAFVAYSTDPEILLMLEARDTPEGPRWFCAPGRSSDKSLFLNYRGQSLWKSHRRGHGSTEPDQEDARYRLSTIGSEDATTMLKKP